MSRCVLAVIHQWPKAKDAVVTRDEYLTLLEVPLRIPDLIICQFDTINGFGEAVTTEHFATQGPRIGLTDVTKNLDIRQSSQIIKNIDHILIAFARPYSSLLLRLSRAVRKAITRLVQVAHCL